jgi:hypothetical protein
MTCENIILLLILILFIIFYKKNKKNSRERFYSSYDFGNTPSYNFNYDYNYGTQCTSCKDKTIKSCKNCVNCGVCYNKISNNLYSSKCVSGDKTGPYFQPKASCDVWDYKNYPLSNASSNIEWPPYNWWGSANWMRPYKYDKPWSLDDDV